MREQARIEGALGGHVTVKTQQPSEYICHCLTAPLLWGWVATTMLALTLLLQEDGLEEGRREEPVQLHKFKLPEALLKARR